MSIPLAITVTVLLEGP